MPNQILFPATSPSGVPVAQPIYIVDIYGNPVSSTNGQNVNVLNANPNGQNTMGNSAPVVIASDQSPVKVRPGFVEVIGQGPGVVNGPNTDLIPAMDISDYNFISLQILGTWSGTLTFQGANDGITFPSILLTTINPNNINFVNNTTADGNFIGPRVMRWLRVRMTSFTSNASLSAILELYTIPPALFSTYLAGGSINATPLATASNLGTTPFHLDSAATINATSVKASLGQIYGFSFSNSNAAVRYVKLYDKASAPTVGTDVPKMTVAVPATNSAHRSFPVGMSFANGIALATTVSLADTDSTAVALHDLSVDLDYK